MANSETVDIYGFVVDTACYNRDFSNPSAITELNQGACVLTDKVASMFGTPKVVRDPRDARVGMSDLVSIPDGAVFENADLKARLQSEQTRLNGVMSIVYDEGKVPEKVQTLLNNGDIMKSLFSYIEVIGNYQIFENDTSRTRQSLEAAHNKASRYATAAGDAQVVITATEDESFVSNIFTEHVFVSDALVPALFSTKRLVRTNADINLILKDSENKPIPVVLHLYWGADKFLSEYPLSTIVDVVFPCQKEKLYELLDAHHGSISEFASSSSKYRTDRIDAIMASDDHSGVFNFTTDYYAYPDTQPTNHFKLSFGVVYKGARPSLDDVKDYLRREVLAIVPTHSEEEWRKKLPGLISERMFFLIPLYSNIWKDTNTPPVEHKWGIIDATEMAALIQNYIGLSYAGQEKYAQYIMVDGGMYPVLCVPHIDNPASARLISHLYPDYIGCTSTDPEFTSMSEFTQDFSEHLIGGALPCAYNNQNKTTVTDINSAWVSFVAADGVTYYVMSRDSVSA